MLLVDQDEVYAVNVDNIIDIFVEGNDVVFRGANGVGLCIGTYKDAEFAVIALHQVFDDIHSGGNVVYMPKDV